MPRNKTAARLPCARRYRTGTLRSASRRIRCAACSGSRCVVRERSAALQATLEQPDANRLDYERSDGRGHGPERDGERREVDPVLGVETLDQQHGAQRDEYVFAKESADVVGGGGNCA